MGLRCLIGHDFGEVQTDREREERGEEVVVTVREFRECARCGETRVISENKEVRTTATPETTAGEEPAESSPATDSTADLDEVSAEEDDGVILEGEPADGERRRGEWPEEDAPAAEAESDDAEPTPWPEVEGDDEGYAAEPSEGDSAEGVDFSGGLTPERAAAEPESAGGAGEEGDVLEASGDRGSSGIRRARASPSPTGRQRAESSDAEFFCPECGYTAPSDGASLRPGDICPECGLGYLGERTS